MNKESLHNLLVKHGWELRSFNSIRPYYENPELTGHAITFNRLSKEWAHGSFVKNVHTDTWGKGLLRLSNFLVRLEKKNFQQSCYA